MKYIMIVSILMITCQFSTTEVDRQKDAIKSAVEANQSDSKPVETIEGRFAPPVGYFRKSEDQQSYAHFLRTFPLLDKRSQVHLFDGTLKYNQSVHAAILDIDVGSGDLQQCADAIMRLRAEYLYNKEHYNDIAFNFTNGWRFEYQKWRAGNQLVVNGNKTNWKSGTTPKDSYEEFRLYLNQVFTYAGTLSLSKELQKKSLEAIDIGDVFIKGGSPGHAVVVVDICSNPATGDKAFMLAQSYMPAQQIHILKNPNNHQLSPWYSLADNTDNLVTPEWTFERNQLKSFAD